MWSPLPLQPGPMVQRCYFLGDIHWSLLMFFKFFIHSNFHYTQLHHIFQYTLKIDFIHILTGICFYINFEYTSNINNKYMSIIINS